ncbi:hypothetical protein ACQ4PT_055205 [Festuca glaucescens]
MGSGLSHNHRSSVSPQQQPSSARVIAADGSLTEFPASSPISVSDVLGDNAGRRFFVCSSDALYFDEDVPALGGGELLRPGQIYFVLPAAKLGRPCRARTWQPWRCGRARRWRRLRARPARGIRKARVAPVHPDTGLGDVLDGEVNEKMNERTLGEDYLTGSGSPTRNVKGSAVAAVPLAKRATPPLGTIQEEDGE